MVDFTEQWEKIQKELGLEDVKDDEVETPSAENPDADIPTAEEDGKQPNQDNNSNNTTPQTFKIKFDGQEVDLSPEDAVKFAQLGKYFETKVKPEYESLKNHSAIKMVNDLAKEFNLSPEDFVKATYADAEKFRVEQTKQKFNIEDDAVAKKLVEQDDKLAQLQAFKTQQEIDAEVNRQIADFQAKYPDVNFGELPKEVNANVKKGMDLTTAYELWTANNKDSEIQRLQAEIDKLKANTNNKDNAPPPIGGNNNGTIADVTSPDFSKNIKSKADLDAWVASLSNIYKQGK